MKKRISVLLVAVLLIVASMPTYRVMASEMHYTYKEVTDDNGTRKAWFVNEEEMDGNPGKLEEGSHVTIEVTPDEECAAYLATFNESTVRVDVCPGVTVTFGSEDSKAFIQGLTCNNANVTVYAHGGEFNEEDGSLPGSVYGVTCFNSTLTFNGNIQYLCLGDEFTYGESDVKVNAGTVVVNGSVYDVQWHTTAEYVKADSSVEYYRGFAGNASVSGEVGNVCIYKIGHSKVLDADIKTTIGIGMERIPSFTIIDGVMTQATSAYIEEIEPDLENFYYEYSPTGDEEGNWWATARYLDGGETGFSKMVSTDEMQTILDSGNGRITFYGGIDSNVNLGDYDFSELKITSGDITVNNITTSDGKGLLQVDSYGRDVINVNVIGDVDECRISYTRFNENMNIDVNGTIKHGQVYKSSLQSDFPIYLGEFTSTDMPLFVDGIWNPDLFLSLGTAEYHPVDDTILEDALGLEKNTNAAGEEITEMADMIVEETTSDALDKLDTDSKFQTCVEEYKNANVLIGVDIELKKYDFNESTQEVSNQEVVTELGDKDLAITVKVPEQDFDENKEYIIIREHDNNGTKEMDVLIPTQDGDKLTFRTNKFSSFIIVEVEEEDIVEENTGESTEDTKEPAEDTKEPAEDTKEPAEGTKEPAEDTKEPAEDTKEPVEDTKEPSSEEETPSEEENETGASKVPDTSDNSNGLVFAMLGIVALIGLILCRKNIVE